MGYVRSVEVRCGGVHMHGGTCEVCGGVEMQVLPIVD